MSIRRNWLLRPFLSILLFVCGATLACSGRAGTSAGAEPTEDTITAILRRGEMRVGYLVWAPTVVKDPVTGTLSGIYVDMVNQIAKSLKVSVSWKETTLATFVAGLNSRQFDFSVGATFVTIPRAASVLFTQPVVYVGNGGVVKRDSSFRPTTIKDLDRPKLRIAVLQGQALDEYCRRNLPKAELLTIAGSDLTAPLAAVSAGRADIGLMNTVTVAGYADQHPEVVPVLTGREQIEILPLAWATRASDAALLSFLNSSITYLRTTGRLEDYQRGYQVRLLFEFPNLQPVR